MLNPPHPEAHLKTAEERLVRLSVLQELTVSALDLFAPETAMGPFLERVAERLGCLAVAWLAIEPGRAPVLVGAAGLSEKSRAMSIEQQASGALDWGTMRVPYPEVAAEEITRWHFWLQERATGGADRSHGLLMWFETRLHPPAEYRPAVERLAGVLRTVLAHRALAEDLRRSYEALEQAQRALVERERLAAVGELAAAVAHEVRNPLAVIFNCVATLGKPALPADEHTALLTILGEEANRLNDTVSELLDFARPRAAVLKLESLEDLVSRAIAGVRDAQTAPSTTDIALVVSGTLHAAMLDAGLVRRAVINLVGNAIQAMPNGGKLIVRLAEERGDDGVFVVIEVRDNGPGIPPNTLERIFEPFFTTKPSGTGLGLSIVKRVAEVHHGTLSVRSVDGGGTTFSLRLPTGEG